MPSRLVKPPSTTRAGPRERADVRATRLRRRSTSTAVCLVLGALTGWLGLAAEAAATPAGTVPAVGSLRAPGWVPDLDAASIGMGAMPVSLGVAASTNAVAPAPPPPETASATPASDAASPSPDTSELVRKRSVPPFWIDRTYTTHRTRAMTFPPVFVHRTPAPDHPEKLFHADLSLTFGWYSKRTARRRWLSPLGLFYGSFSERKSVWGSGALLMGYRRVGEQFNFGQFPLVWWWGTKFVKNFLFVPFHYQKKSPDGFQGVSALLFWYGHKNLDDTDLQNDRRHFVAAPVFWRFRRGLSQFDFAFLYVGGYNKLEGLEYKAAAPFFVWRRSEFGNRRELWTLPWIRRVDEARGQRTWAVPLALTFSVRDRERSLLSATPLVWRSENRLEGSKFLYAGLYGRYDDPDQRNSFVAPLWYSFTDKNAGSTTRLLVPLAFARTTPEGTGVYTLLGGGRRSTKGWGMAVPPLLTFAGRRDDGTRYQGLLGAFWHVRKPATDDRPETDTWVVGPLAFGKRKGERFHVGLPPLLTFAGWGGGKHYQVVTPLLWHVRDADPQTRRRTLVAGPFYHHRTVAGFDGGLAPLWFYGNNEQFRYAVVPGLLFGHVHHKSENRRLTLSPLFIRSSGPDHRTTGVLGLGWDVARPGERHTGVFPFFYRRRVGDRTLVVTPVGGSYRRPEALTSVFGPVYVWRSAERRGWGAIPLVFHDVRQVDGGTATHTVLPPLWLRRRTPTDSVDMWTPLVWRTRYEGEKTRRGLAVVPFYFRQRQPGGVDVDAGLGFFYSRDPYRHTHTIIAGTAFHRLSRTSLNTGVAPIYWWHDSEKRRRLLALPAIFHFEDKDVNAHTTIAPPFWFDRLQPNGRRGWAAFPFVFGNKRLYNFTRFSLVPPGYVDMFRIHRNMRFSGFVPLLFRYQKCGFLSEDDASCRYTLWGSVPFFMYGKDGQGRVTHGALLAYYFDRRPDGWKLYTPLFGVNNEPGRTLGWYAGPLAIKTTQTHRRMLLFPLYYRRAHRLEDENLTLVAPPLFVGRHRKDRRFFEAGLVLWQFRQQHKVSTAVLPPVFFHSHAYAQRRLTWLMPLFYRDNHWGKDHSFTALAPVLYFQRRKGQDLDFVQFPLVWHIERGENQGTFGAFAWWDIRVEGKTFQMVPAAFFRWATPEKDTKVIGPGLAWWSTGRGANEGDSSWRILFGLFGGGRENGERYATIFGAKVRRGPAPPRTKKSAERDRRRAERRQRMAERRQRHRNAQTARNRPTATR